MIKISEDKPFVKLFQSVSNEAEMQTEMQMSHFNRPWETAAPPSISPPIPAPRNLATSLSIQAQATPLSIPHPIPARRNLATSLSIQAQAASPSTSPLPPVVSSASLQLAEAHKGGTRMILDGYMYVRDRSRKDVT